MIRYFFIIFISVVGLSVPAVSQTEKSSEQEIETAVEEEDGIVRGLIWGLSPDIVKAYEKSTFLEEEENTLFYFDTMWGMRSLIGYEFLDNKLWRIRIFNEKKYSDPKERILDVMRLQVALEERFGAPVLRELKWKDDKEKEFPKYWGWALYQGDLEIRMSWHSEDTEVTLTAGKSDEPYNPKVVVEYKNKEIEPAPRKRKPLFGDVFVN